MKPGKVVLVRAARSTVNFHVPLGTGRVKSFLSRLRECSLFISAIPSLFIPSPSLVANRPSPRCLFHVVNVLLFSFRKHYVELLVQIAPLVDLCSVWLAGTVQGLTCREHLVAQVNWGRLRWLIALFEIKTQDRRVCVTGKMFCWGRSHQQPGGRGSRSRNICEVRAMVRLVSIALGTRYRWKAPG